MATNPLFDSSLLQKNGLNLHFIFNLEDLPQNITEQLKQNGAQLQDFKQLILVAHGGKDMWATLDQNSGSAHPIDHMSVSTVSQALNKLSLIHI